MTNELEFGGDIPSENPAQPNTGKLALALEERRKKNEVAPEPAVDYSKYADLIPTLDYDASSDVTDQIKSISIIDAYRALCGKITPYHMGRGEWRIACPNPSHPDKHPSGSANIDKGQWTCHACGKSSGKFYGGDIFDLAAVCYGYDIDSYKAEHFPEIKSKLAETFGLSVPVVTAPIVSEPVPAAPDVRPKAYSRLRGDGSTYQRLMSALETGRLKR